MRARLALLALLLPATAFADYRSDYRDGVVAAERQDWARVETLMRRAIADQPTPNPQARIRIYASSFVPYVPYFYLGLAAFSRGDCATAVSLFEDSRHAGTLRGLRESDRQAMMLRSCKAKLAATAAATAAAPEPAKPANATPPPRPVAVAPAASAPPPRPTAANPLPPPAPAAVAVADARLALERALERGGGQLAKASDPDSVEAKSLASALTNGRAGLGSADASRLQGAVQAIEAAGRALDVAHARRALADQVRGRLQPLAEAYLGGDFARAAQWADEQALGSVPQALAEALLLRAAARYELYVLGGERDLDLFDRIRDDVRAARQADAGIQPSERAFSPRFRVLFASTR
jgi:hypothetical protein